MFRSRILNIQKVRSRSNMWLFEFFGQPSKNILCFLFFPSFFIQHGLAFFQTIKFISFIVQYEAFSNWKPFEYFFSIIYQKWIIFDQKCQVQETFGTFIGFFLLHFWDHFWDLMGPFGTFWDLLGPFGDTFFNLSIFFIFIFSSSMTSTGNPRDWSFWTKSAEFPGQMALILLKLPLRVKPTIWQLILSL